MSKLKVSCTTPDRTINLAKEGNSLEERRTKLLIYERKPFEEPFCGAQIPIGIKSTPKSAKRIRVCTAADLKKTCPPIMCTCPPQKPPLTLCAYIKKAMSLGIRSAIVGGLIYWTWNIGIWDDASHTERLYVKLKNSLCSKKDDEEDKELDGSLRMDRTMQAGREKWNLAVSKSFQIVRMLTEKADSVVNPADECETDTPQTDEPK